MTLKDDIKAALALLVEPGHVFELRAPKPRGRGRGQSGYFDDLDKAAGAAFAIDGKYQGIYVTLNPCKPELLARAANRLKDAEETTTDGQITRRRWFAVDCDPLRDPGISSSDEEHDKALAKAREIWFWLAGQGWPAPLVADSGNGGHLLYRIDLPNDETSRVLLLNCLTALAARFDGDGVEIDRKVFNASRIWKLYGTLACKGDDVPDRPHRRAMVLSGPSAEAVPVEKLEALAQLAPKQTQQSATPAKRAANGGLHPYVAKALEDETAKVRNAPSGQRNETLFKAAVSLYGFVLSKALDETELDQALNDAAAACGLSGHEVDSTIRSGKSKAQPRDIPAGKLSRTNAPSVDVAALLAGINQAADAGEKARAIEDAVLLASTMPLIQAEAALAAIKTAAKGTVKASAIDKLAKEARQTKQERAAQTTAQPDASPYFRIVDGELWGGHGEDAFPLTQGGACKYSEMVRVDDGESTALTLTLDVMIRDRETLQARVPAGDSGAPDKLVKALREVSGPLISVVSSRQKMLPQAIDAVSRGHLLEVTEIAHTGWVELDDGSLAFVTPGGLVGSLPSDFRVGLPDDMARFAVMDGGDDAFAAGLHGLVAGFVGEAFEARITMPALAFAFLPPAARFFGLGQKFLMHFSGETGSLKTHTAKALMSLYGARFVNTSPLASFISTTNAIERMGFHLPDVMGLVDDYKPRLLKNVQFVDMVHRYADGNDRARMSQSGVDLQRRKVPRWWMLSTGEDVPTGESSLLARMIVLRFPRRPQGSPYNDGLAKMQRLAGGFPTVMARWVQWLAEKGRDFDFPARQTLFHQQIASHIQANLPDVPNVNRIAQNFAMLVTSWVAFWEFYYDAWGSTHGRTHADCERTQNRFMPIALELALAQAKQAQEQKPAHIFLEAVQEGLDSGEFELLPIEQLGTTALRALAGWYDDKGVYLLPSIFDRVAERKFKAQQALGFSRPELYRLLTEEGLVARAGKQAPTVVIKVGNPTNSRTARVLHLKPDVLIPPTQAGGAGDTAVADVF